MQMWLMTSQGRGSHAGRATSLRVRTICERRAWHLPLPWGWGEGELSSRRFHGASSSEQVTLQTRGQFLAALDVNVRLAAIWENHPHHAKATSSLWPCRPPPGEGTRPTSPAKPPSCRPGALTRRSHLCPIAELGFLRISTQKFINAPMDKARRLLETFARERKAERIADDLPALDTHPAKTEAAPRSVARTLPVIASTSLSDFVSCVFVRRARRRPVPGRE